MNPRVHSRLARNLIKACGGLEESAQACRIGKSQLSNAQNANHDAILPADVIQELESYCGDPLYSRALLEACQAVSGTGDIVGEALDVVGQVATLSAHIHHALADNVVTPSEANKVADMIVVIRQSVAQIENDIETAADGAVKLVSSKPKPSKSKGGA